MEEAGPSLPQSPTALEELRALFVQHAPQAIAMFDREMRYLLTTQRWVTDYQLEGKEIIGRSHYEVFPEIPERWKDSHRRCLAGATVQSDQDFFVRADGRVMWLRYDVRPWRDSRGEIGGLLMFTEDISARLKAEEALRESESRMRVAVEATGLGTWDFDPVAWTVAADRRTKDLFGISPDEEMSYDDFLRALHPEGRKEVHTAVLRALEPSGGGAFSAEYRVIVGEGPERWIQARGKVLFSPEGRALRIIGTVLDVTERNRARQALEHAFAQAQAALRTRDEFVSIASHEMRTPLTSMTAQIQQLQKLVVRTEEGCLDVKRVQPMITLALRQLRRLQLLTEQLLDVDRIGNLPFELEYEPLDLRTVLEAEILERREAAQRARTELRLEAPQHLFGVWDRWRLEQMIGPLLDNALKFGAGKPVAIRLFQNPDAATASISVSDQGIGIDEKDHARIFGRFERAVDSDHYGGFGVGLWIVRRIVDAFGGRIALESAPRKGSTFTVELPRSPLHPGPRTRPRLPSTMLELPPHPEDGCSQDHGLHPAGAPF